MLDNDVSQIPANGIDEVRVCNSGTNLKRRHAPDTIEELRADLRSISGSASEKKENSQLHFKSARLEQALDDAGAIPNAPPRVEEVADKDTEAASVAKNGDGTCRSADVTTKPRLTPSETESPHEPQCKRRKKEQRPQPPPPTRPGQCHFFIKRKQRYCSLSARTATHFCGEHLALAPPEVQAQAFGSDGKRHRIPCPLDPNQLRIGIYEFNIETDFSFVNILSR